MFEHVGAAHFDEFFATCRALLADDGVMLLHTIGKYGKVAAPDPFTDKCIFPGYHLPSISQLAAATEKMKFIISDIEILRVHYAYTLDHWLRRTQKAKAKIVALYDERFYRMWEFYLAGGVVAFENGSMCNYQVQYIRDRNARADHPRLHDRGRSRNIARWTPPPAPRPSRSGRGGKKLADA